MIDYLDLLLFAVVIMAIFITILFVFVLQFTKVQKQRAKELMAIRKENLETQKEILKEVKALQKRMDSRN